MTGVNSGMGTSCGSIRPSWPCSRSQIRT